MDQQYYFAFFPTHSSNLKTQVHNTDILNYDYYELLTGKTMFKDFNFIGKKGFEAYDLLITSHPSLFLLSSRMMKLLRKAQIKGLIETEVKVTENKTGITAAYYFIQILNISSGFDYSKSTMISEISGFIELKGRYVDPFSILDADIFVVNQTLSKYVKEWVKDLLEKEKLKNVEFTRNDEVIGAIPIEMYRQ